MQAKITAVLKALCEIEILIGSQALAFWSAHYWIGYVDFDLVGGMSKDVDVFGDRDTVAAIASAVNGIASSLITWPP